VLARRHPIEPDLSLSLTGADGAAPCERHVHWACVGQCCEFVSRMTSAGIQETKQHVVKLTLPAHTDGHVDALLRFCYNRKLNVDFASGAAHVVDLWRLADYLNCHPLLRLLEAGIVEHTTPGGFVAGVRRALERADPASERVLVLLEQV
jgi:hypothetical protein